MPEELEIIAQIRLKTRQGLTLNSDSTHPKTGNCNLSDRDKNQLNRRINSDRYAEEQRDVPSIPIYRFYRYIYIY